MRNDPQHRKDLDLALKYGDDIANRKKADVADDNDQWITPDPTYKSISHSYGMTLDKMSDATPFDKFWETVRCWNAILEILAWVVYWLNPPFGKNV
jgi:hypothetical protein